MITAENTITVRPARDDERRGYALSRGGDPAKLQGFVIVEDAGSRIGHTGYRENDGAFEVHDTLVQDASGRGMAVLAQYLRKLAADCGHDHVTFFIDAPFDSPMMKMIEHGFAEMTQIKARVKV